MSTVKDLIQSVVKEIETPQGKMRYVSLSDLEKQGYAIRKMPYIVRIFLENALRNYDGFAVTDEHIRLLLHWKPKPEEEEFPYKPSRVLMQDFTGVPAVVDLAAIRSELQRKGKSVQKANPKVPVDLVIDHSVQVNFFGSQDAYERNVALEYERNQERYRLLKWAQQAFDNFSVLPPGMGICHQVNLEFLAKVVTYRDGWAFPDTAVGTDSHTPMVSGMGVVAWGVGGIEAEAALLGQPIYLLLPQVIGLKLEGELPPGTTTTDLVLTITRILREYGVVGKFVEVFGPALKNLSVPDRATIANMSPEFGCTTTFFPVDDRTLQYLKGTARSEEHIAFVERYCKENLLWRDENETAQYTDVITLDLSTIEPTISGPKRPHDYIPLRKAKEQVYTILEKEFQRTQPKSTEIRNELCYTLQDGAIAIAAITSCTNTSNPTVMLGAGLLAKKAVEKGLTTKPWVKTSLAPGSRVVTQYLERTGLLPYLEALRFHVVGYGCTTCIGNSGDLPEKIRKAAEEGLILASALSGNRNFEARIHPLVKMNFLASPLLVVAYALAGKITIDFEKEPIGFTPNGEPVYLKDLWPSAEAIADLWNNALDPQAFKETYAKAYEGDERWKQLQAPSSAVFEWDENSTYIKEPPFFINISEEPPALQDITNARVLLVLGDTVTTDHISPAGAIPVNSPAGQYLIAHGVQPKDFNTYGARRGNHEVMMRGTFANVRLKNRLVDKEGGFTVYHPTKEVMTVYEAAMRYKENQIPLIVLAGKEYGSGSSRDWAAKGTALLNIKAVIAQSFERIHRSNLIGMGVLPIQFLDGQSYESLGLTGEETYTIEGIRTLTPKKKLKITATKPDGTTITFEAIARVDSEIEVAYYQHGGILHYVIRKMLKED